MGILFKKHNVRVFARLQALLSPLPDAENPISVTQPSYTQEFTVILQIFSYKALRGDSRGNGIGVKCQIDPVTLRDNGGDLIKCNTLLYQLRSCVGRPEKYREGTQVCQSLKIPPSALTYKKEILSCSQHRCQSQSRPQSSPYCLLHIFKKRSVLLMMQKSHARKPWQVFFGQLLENNLGRRVRSSNAICRLSLDGQRQGIKNSNPRPSFINNNCGRPGFAY